MKAAICNELGKPLEIEEVDVSPPGPGEVKVKVAATAVCRSDLHVMDGPAAHAQLPGLPGHETAGYVEEVGEGVTRVKPGEAVCVTTSTVGCGYCANCLNGMRTLCTTYPLFGGPGREPRIHNKKGQPVATMAGTVGGFAEYVVVKEFQVVQIPDDMPIDRAACLSCAVVTGFGSSMTAGVKPFSSSLIIGTGAVGLNAIQGSSFLGACPVIAMDFLDNRLEAARTFGATHTINSKNLDDPIKAVQDLTDGNGADYVFITVTLMDNNLLSQALEMSSQRGVVIRIAMGQMGPPSDDISWARPLVQRGAQRVIIGTMMGSSNIIQDIPRYVKLYKAGRLKLDELITGHYPLEKINEAIASLRTGEAIRNVIMFQ